MIRALPLMCIFGLTLVASAQTTFSVVNNSSSSYRFNGGVTDNPTLTLQRGVTYTFNINAPGHPFYIKTALTTGTGEQYTSGVTGNGTSTVTFTVPVGAPNTLYYHCSAHSAMGGTINIVTANAAPSISITNPANGAVVAAPANVTIQATATDTDGSVTNVQFLTGTAVVGNDTTLPYAAVTNGLPAGNYTLSAVASDNAGAKATNSVSIIVNAPPSINLTNPLNNARFRAPANFSLQAAASDVGGSVTNVQFFTNEVVCGSLSGAPFNLGLTNLPAGNYALRARAVDNLGFATTSSVVNVFVLTNAVLSAPARLPNGQFRFTVQGIAGQTYATELSTNLTNWSAFLTNVAPANTFNITDFTSTNILLRHYRARQDL